MTLESTVAILRGSYRPIKFKSSDRFCWSPETKEIFFDAEAQQPSGIWSLLHETGHAILGHTSYTTDYELIKIEVAAWEKAKALASDMGIEIDEDHVQDCIDTYRDWLYGRSICPTCDTKSLQQAELSEYQCFNCHATWRVTPSRFCRAYRTLDTSKKPSAVFALTDDSI
jgi:hypothetical protein